MALKLLSHHLARPSALGVQPKSLFVRRCASSAHSCSCSQRSVLLLQRSFLPDRSEVPTLQRSFLPNSGRL